MARSLPRPVFDEAAQARRKAPATCACPCCQGQMKRVQAVDEGNASVVLATFDEGEGLGISHDNPAAYQCQACHAMTYLAI